MDERTKFTIGAWLIVALVFLAILLVAINAGGCSQVTMSPQYKANLEMSNIAVQEMNERCIGGDPNACRDGLAESAEMLQLLVDAVHGVESKGGQQ